MDIWEFVVGSVGHSVVGRSICSFRYGFGHRLWEEVEPSLSERSREVQHSKAVYKVASTNYVYISQAGDKVNWDAP